MRIEEYENQKLKALDFIAKAGKINKLEEKNKLLDQAEEIILNLKNEVEIRKKIAFKQLKNHEMKLKTKSVIEAMI